MEHLEKVEGHVLIEMNYELQLKVVQNNSRDLQFGEWERFALQLALQRLNVIQVSTGVQFAMREVTARTTRQLH